MKTAAMIVCITAISFAASILIFWAMMAVFGGDSNIYAFLSLAMGAAMTAVCLIAVREGAP